MGALAEFTDNNFDSEVLNSDGPVLVHFWAPWCGPCRQLMPMIEEMAGQYDGAVKFGKLNIDDNPNMAVKYKVRGVPTLMIFKEGNIIENIVGVPSRSKLTDALEKAKE